VYWEIHRHRLAPLIAETLDSVRTTGRLKVYAGRILGYRAFEGGLEVRIRPRGKADPVSIDVGRIINCTGPTTNPRKIRDPLFESMLRSGSLVPDALGLGVITSPDGALRNIHGGTSSRVFLAGPLRIAELWETTAVPELRLQTALLAEHLAARDAASTAERSPQPRGVEKNIIEEGLLNHAR
jgi:uncharacterized NAD(P)/FAD-binding protein YdhS